MKKKKNKSKIALISLSITWIVSLCAAATYAWVARSWSPSIQYGEINIATSGAIVIEIEDKDGYTGVYNDININELTGINSFALKQVSSSNGINFVSADFNPILSGKSPVYDDQVHGKYIETTFHLKAQKYNGEGLENIKEVFIHPDSLLSFKPLSEIENENSSESVEGLPESSEEDLLNPLAQEESYNVEKAIRVSIQVQDQISAYMFCADRGDEEGQDGIYQFQAVDTSPEGYKNSLGKDLYNNFKTEDEEINTSVFADQICYTFDYYNGETTERTLFKINQEVPVKVTVRIWLEGCDEYCVNQIAGKSLSLLLKFDCKDVVKSS